MRKRVLNFTQLLCIQRQGAADASGRCKLYGGLGKDMRQGWVERLAEGECMMALRIDCLVALRLAVTPRVGSPRPRTDDAEKLEGVGHLCMRESL